MSARLRVLVVDDARLARREMQTLLAAMDGVECIGEADDVPAAREALARLHPDVVLLDIQMPSGSGFDVLDGLQVRGFGAALWGSLLYSALGLLIDSALRRLFPKT